MDVVLVGHGALAIEMLNSCEMIVGNTKKIFSIDFKENEGLNHIEEKIESKVGGRHRDLLIFTDLFGGTPFNSACSFAMKNPKRKIRVLSGMSLPLVLEIALSKEQLTIEELTDKIIGNSRKVCREFILEEEGDEL